MSCLTPRMSAWSPPDSLSGTPTSSSGSLPRTPTDDAPAPAAGVAPPPPASRTAVKTEHGAEDRPMKAKGLLSFSSSTISSPSLSSQPASARSALALSEGRVSSGGPNTTFSSSSSYELSAPFAQSGPSAAASSSATKRESGSSSVPNSVPASGATTTSPVATRVAPLGLTSLASSAQQGKSLPRPLPTASARLPAAKSVGPGTPPSKVNGSSRLSKDASASLLPPPAGVPRKRRKRSTPEQIEVLERHFAANDRPSSASREAIASELNMTARQVQIWMQNRRQTRKKRLLEAAGEVFRPSSPTSLGGHPSSDSVGSIPSSEMDDLPFTTVYGARRVVSGGLSSATNSNKENRPVLAGSRSLPPLGSSSTITGVAPSGTKLPPSPKSPVAVRAVVTSSAAPAKQIALGRSPSLPCASRSVGPGRATLTRATDHFGSPRSSSMTSLSAQVASSSTSQPSLLDKCVQSRELPFVHQKRPRASLAGSATTLGPSTMANLPVMSWRDDEGDEEERRLASGRDVWRHMMSDPPSGGLLELYEDENDADDSSSDRAGPLTDDDEDVTLQPAKVRRTSSSSSSAGSASRRQQQNQQQQQQQQQHCSTKDIDGGLRSLRRSCSSSTNLTPGAVAALPSHLERRPSFRRSASLDCAASRMRPSPAASALAHKRARAAAAAGDGGGRMSSIALAALDGSAGTGRRRSLPREASADSSVSSIGATSASPFPPPPGHARPATKPAVGASRSHNADDVECARLLMGLLGGA